jgi:hypothetical protein
MQEEGQLIDSFMVFGLSKGTVVFVQSDKTLEIYCRVSVHQERILLVKNIRDLDLFLSVCASNILIIWKFDHFAKKQLVILHKVHLHRPIKDVLCCHNKILIGFASGDL